MAKLERYLKHFPPNAVHLQITLEEISRKSLYTVTLNLRVPSNILHVEKTAQVLIEAFDDAFKLLLRELKSFKATLRGEKFWKRKERRKELHERKASGFAIEPQRNKTGPQKYQDLVRDLFQQHRAELLHHIRRHIRQDELAGDLPRNSIDAGEILKAVGRRAVTDAAEGPGETNWLLWFYHLIHRELTRRRLSHKKGSKENVRDQTQTSSAPAERNGQRCLPSA
jgi:ribosome-associated translation inhibitor RaiA